MSRERDAVDEVMSARILVVEDEKIIARDIAQTLAQFGYEVVGIVDTAADAVRCTLDQAPDLVLMDIHLRGEPDGIDAAEQIRAAGDTPVVFLTAFADEATLERARRVAPYGYVLKPFDDRELQVATMMALCKHRAFVDLDQRVRERTEALLHSEARLRQVSALAELGVFALRTHSLQAVLDHALRIVAATLGTELVEIAELVADGTALHRRAGLGWRSDRVDAPRIALDADALARQALEASVPVLVEQRRADDAPRDAAVPATLVEHGVVSGVRVVILSSGDERPYGVLGAFTTTRRSFSASELAFVQASANLIGTSIARDLADERRLVAERAAEHARARAEHADEAIRLRDEFLSIASHELKTPLTSLQLQLQNLSARLDSLDSRVGSKLERATRSTERLSSLVEALLDVSRLTTGAIAFEPEALVVQELVHEVVERVRESAAQARCTLHVVEATTQPLHARWDRVRVEQMLLNLLSNAFKYGAGAPVELTVARDGDAAELSVCDHGPGIAPEHAERIFERFERAASIRHYGGLGLGLYITRQLAEAHGGSVSIRSTPGAGACFVLRLPLACEGE